MRKFIRTLVFFITIGFGAVQANASPQMPDYLIYEGDTIAFYHLILEDYFNAQNMKDEGALFGLKFRSGASTNCWRGYQAIYEIDNDSLFLNQIIHCGQLLANSGIDEEKSKSRMNEIFAEQMKNGRVHLNWYSSAISIPVADILRWDGVFYYSFEKEKLISIKSGIVTSFTPITNYIDDPDRINRRYTDTLSTVLFKELKNINWNNEDDYDCSEKYLVTIDKKGEISEVIMTEYRTKKEIKEFWDMPEYNYCIRTIKSRLEHLKFDVIKKAGKPIEEQVFLEIWVDDNGTLENWTY